MDYDENNEEYEKLKIECILLGESGVGKTNLTNSLVDVRFEQSSKSTVNALYVQKDMNIAGKEYQIRLWDTAGQEKYRSLTKLFYKESKVVIFVYDITNKKSFTELNYWINEIKESLGEEPILGMVGNKSDMEDMKKVDDGEAQKLADEHNMKFQLVSVKNEPKDFKNFLQQLILDYIVKNNYNKDTDNFDLEYQYERDYNAHGSCTIF